MITRLVSRSVIREYSRSVAYRVGGGNPPPVRDKLLLTLRPYAYGEDVILDDIYAHLGEDVVVEWRERYGEDVPIVAYMIPESLQTEMFAIFGEGLWFDSDGTAKQVNCIELAQSPEINQWAVWYRLDAAAGLGNREVLFYDHDTLLDADVTKIAAWFKKPGATSSPSAFFNGLDFRLATYTGGPAYVPDHLGVLRTPGSNLPAVQGMRLATTVSDGAELGPELEPSPTTGGTWSAAGTTPPTVNSNDNFNGVPCKSVTFSAVASGGSTISRASGALIPVSAGETFETTYTVALSRNLYESESLVVVYTGIAAIGRLTITSSYSLSVLTEFLINAGIVTAIGDIRLSVYPSSGLISPVTVYISKASIKKIIPTYVTTDSSGNPIVASTPQKTVTYSTDWLSRTFAETFDKFDISDPLKAPGWLCEPVRTNKCTCRKSNPVDTSGLTKSGDAAAVLSVVDDTAALTAAGLIGICNSGKVYKLDNSMGTGAVYAIISGVTSNINAHSMSIVGRITSGIGGIRLNSGSGVLAATFTSNTYLKYTANNITPESTSRSIIVDLSVGAVVYFILPQLEEGPFRTSPIAKLQDGTDPLTAITRAATVASFPTAGKIPVNDFAIRMIVVPRASGQNAVWMFSSYVDSNNYTGIFIAPAYIIARKRIAGVSTDTNVTYSHSNNTPFDVLIYSSSEHGVQLSVRQFSSSWGSFTNSTANISTAAKANVQLASTYQLGALNGSSQFTGNISLFDCVPIPAGTTDPMAWAKTHWGVA